MESLSRISQPEGHKFELEESERGCYGRLWDVFWGYWNLVICALQINTSENFLTMHDAGEVLDVWHGIPVWHGDGVQIPVVTTGSPLAIRLFDKVKWAGPATFRRLTYALIH